MRTAGLYTRPFQEGEGVETTWVTGTDFLWGLQAFPYVFIIFFISEIVELQYGHTYNI